MACDTLTPADYTTRHAAALRAARQLEQALANLAELPADDPAAPQPKSEDGTGWADIADELPGLTWAVDRVLDVLDGEADGAVRDLADA